MEEDKIGALKSEFQKEYPEFIAFWANYGRPILTAILVAVLAYTAARYYFGRESSDAASASTAFSQAQSIADLEKITVDYADTPSATLAELSLAKYYFDSGDYDNALNRYMSFLQAHPEHPLAVSAELNRIFCIEARGNTQQALELFAQFVADRPDHFLSNEALFGKARCLEKLNMPGKARIVYEDYMVANPDGSYFGRAEDAIKLLDRKAENTESTDEAPPAAE